MIGLIAKGSAALILDGQDPGPRQAAALVNYLLAENSRAFASALDALNLERASRPKPFTLINLAWHYVFVRSDDDERRLETGPFDEEMTVIVRAIEASARRQNQRRLRALRKSSLTGA